MKKVGNLLLVIFIVLVALNTYVRNMESIPDHAVVICDIFTNEYLAPPYVDMTKQEAQSGRYFVARLKDAEDSGFKASYEHRNAGYFIFDEGIVWHWLGLGKKPEWGKDGNWGYDNWENIIE